MIALFAMVLLGALITAIVFAANEETRASTSVLGVSRALSAAESAVGERILTLDGDSALQMQPGQFTTVTVNGYTGPAEVSLVRLDSTCFWVQARAHDISPASKNSGAERMVGITIEVIRDSTGRPRAAKVPYRSWTELF